MNPPSFNNLIALDTNSTMARAYLLMERFNCDVMPVAFEGKIVGVISMRDIQKLAQNCATGGGDDGGRLVGQHMRSPVVPVEAGNNLAEVIRGMIDGNIQALIVQDQDRILGTLSRDKLLKLLAELTARTKTTVLEALKILTQHS
jgi:predicted transcriptional regulator